MDDNNFFRDASLRICGNLKIENALHDCLSYLRAAMPADSIILNSHDKDFNAVRAVARATATAYRKLNLPTPLSQQAKLSGRELETTGVDGLYVLEKSADYDICKELQNYHQIECDSLILMILGGEGRVLGSVLLIAKDNSKFTNEHGRLLSLLREPFALALSNAIGHDDTVKLRALLAEDERKYLENLGVFHGDDQGESPYGFREVMEKIRQLASTDDPVLIWGDMGVDGRVVAGSIHNLSNRADGPFISLDCGAIPESEIEEGLFGGDEHVLHIESFSKGYLERAHKGTLYIGEIGKLTMQAQERLMNFIQSGSIERADGLTAIPLDVKIVAGTELNLEGMVKAGIFLENLLMHLMVFSLWIPPTPPRALPPTEI